MKKIIYTLLILCNLTALHAAAPRPGAIEEQITAIDAQILQLNAQLAPLLSDFDLQLKRPDHTLPGRIMAIRDQIRRLEAQRNQFRD